MKAVVGKAWGLPETLIIEERSEPQPKPGEVLVDVMAAGVNFPDVLIIQNKYQFKLGNFIRPIAAHRLKLYIEPFHENFQRVLRP